MCVLVYALAVDQYFFDLPRSPGLLSVTSAAERLGVTRPGAAEILHSGLADTAAGAGPSSPAAYAGPRGPVVSEAAVDALAQRPFVDLEAPHGKAVNVRVRAARRVDDSDRDVMGWHARLSPTQVDSATARWWARPGFNAIGAPFVATVAGFVVVCGRIAGWTEDRGKVAYQIDWSDTEVAEFWADKRVHTPRGGTVVYL